MKVFLFVGTNYDSGMPIKVAISEHTPLEMKPHDLPEKTLVIVPHYKILVDKSLEAIVADLDQKSE